MPVVVEAVGRSVWRAGCPQGGGGREGVRLEGFALDDAQGAV